jgi:hypothetical protein
MKKPGDRVGAILSATDTEVQFIGYGVYEGDYEVEAGVGGMGELLREAQIPNPRIKLDSGETVYGCECWWGSEERVKKQLEGKKVIMVSPSEFRKQE